MSYESLNKEELLAKISELEQEIKASKKYGLVWDKEATKEEVVQRCETDIPVLVMDEGKTILNGGQNNVLIEGDNFHALTALNMIAKNTVDLIYIDPPYNTGNRDFVYNDNYVNADDGYRHSKWLNFIQKRLVLAKELLKDSGAIFISIDEHEEAQLKILCDSVFGERNRIGTLIWRKKSGGGQTDEFFVTEHEYIVGYRKTERFEWHSKIAEANASDFKYEDDKGLYSITKLEKWGSSAHREDRPTMYFPIQDPEGNELFPVAPDGKAGRWRVGKERLMKLIKNGEVHWNKDNRLNRWVPYEKNYYLNAQGKLLKSRSIIYDLAETGTATKLLTTIFNEKDVFQNPKPVELIQFLIDHTNSDVVLDFFAGSGTTGQAVLEQNKLDNGKRKFILCTNNESGICDRVTYPRIKTVLTGFREDGTPYSDGLKGNLYYFNTAFIKDNKNSDQAKYNLVEKIDALLCIAEDIYVKKETTNYSSHYCNTEEDRHMFIYNDYYNKEKFSSFIEHINNCYGKKTVYIFSTTNEIDESLFEGMSDVTVKPIPAKIYEIYKEIAEDVKRG